MVIIAHGVISHRIIRAVVILVNVNSVLILLFHLFDGFKDFLIYLLEFGIKNKAVRALLYLGILYHFVARSANQLPLAFRTDKRQFGIGVFQGYIFVAPATADPLEYHFELLLVDSKMFRCFCCPICSSELLRV